MGRVHADGGRTYRDDADGLKAAMKSLSCNIENAADLVQLIEEDVIDMVLRDSVPNLPRAHAVNANLKL